MRMPSIMLVATLCALMLAGLLAGCGETARNSPEQENPGPPVAPPAADLSTPEAAVASYLEWVTYAYRTADSDVASHTMTPSEGVRVDAYIELNRQNGTAIEQQLVRFSAPSASSEGTMAVVVASEDWEYRYIAIDSGSYDGPLEEVSYDATYTLVLDRGTWLVDRVEATPLAPLE